MSRKHRIFHHLFTWHVIFFKCHFDCPFLFLCVSHKNAWQILWRTHHTVNYSWDILIISLINYHQLKIYTQSNAGPLLVIANSRKLCFIIIPFHLIGCERGFDKFSIVSLASSSGMQYDLQDRLLCPLSAYT